MHRSASICSDTTTHGQVSAVRLPVVGISNPPGMPSEQGKNVPCWRAFVTCTVWHCHPHDILRILLLLTRRLPLYLLRSILMDTTLRCRALRGSTCLFGSGSYGCPYDTWHADPAATTGHSSKCCTHNAAGEMKCYVVFSSVTCAYVLCLVRTAAIHAACSRAAASLSPNDATAAGKSFELRMPPSRVTCACCAQIRLPCSSNNSSKSTFVNNNSSSYTSRCSRCVMSQYALFALMIIHVYMLGRVQSAARLSAAARAWAALSSAAAATALRVPQLLPCYLILV